MQIVACWHKSTEILKNNSNHIDRWQYFPCSLVEGSETEKVNLSPRPMYPPI